MRVSRMLVAAAIAAVVVVVGSTGAASAAPADGPRLVAQPGDVTGFQVLDDEVYVVSDTAQDGSYRLWHYAADGTGGIVAGSPTGDTTMTPFQHELLLPGMLSTYDPATSSFRSWTGLADVVGPGTAFVADGVIHFSAYLTSGHYGGWTSTDGIAFTPVANAIAEESRAISGGVTYAIERDENTSVSTVVSDDGTTRTPIPGSPADPEYLAAIGDELFILTTAGTLEHYTAGDPAPAPVPGLPASVSNLAPVGDGVVVEDATTLYHVTDDLTVTSQPFGAGAPSDPVGSAILGGVDYLTGSDGMTRGLWSYANGTFRQVQPPTGTVDGAFSIVEASTDSVYFLASSSVRGLLALYVYRPGSSTAGTGTTATDPAPTLAATGLAPEGALGAALVLLILGALLMVGRRRLAE